MFFASKLSEKSLDSNFFLHFVLNFTYNLLNYFSTTVQVPLLLPSALWETPDRKTQLLNVLLKWRTCVMLCTTLFVLITTSLFCSICLAHIIRCQFLSFSPPFSCLPFLFRSHCHLFSFFCISPKTHSSFLLFFASALFNLLFSSLFPFLRSSLYYPFSCPFLGLPLNGFTMTYDHFLRLFWSPSRLPYVKVLSINKWFFGHQFVLWGHLSCFPGLCFPLELSSLASADESPCCDFS